MNDVQLFIGQKACIRRGEELLIVVDEILGADLPGGKVQVGETDFTASLQREVMEETGLSISVGDPFEVWYYEFAPDSPHRNAGKKIYCVAFCATYVSGEVTISDEHTSFVWVTKETFPEHVARENNYYEIIQKYFALQP